MDKLNLCEFIRFWSQFYNDSKNLDEKYYFPHILPMNRPLNPNDLEKLFEWKNGMPLWQWQRIQEVLQKIEISIQD